MNTRTSPPLLRALFAGRDTEDNRLQAVIEQMPAATLLAAQKSGTLIALNSKATALTGWSRAELLRLALAELVLAPAAADALEEIHQVEPGQARLIIDVPLATRAGRPLAVDLRLAAFAEPAQGDVLVLIQAAPADERVNQARQATQGAQALDSFEHMIRLLADPADNALGLAVELIRNMLAADAAGLYHAAPDQPMWQLFAVTDRPKAFPQQFGPSEAQYLAQPARWVASQRPEGYLQQAARSAGWGQMLSHPVGLPGLVGAVVVAYKPGVAAPAEAPRLLTIGALYLHQLTTQIQRHAAYLRTNELALRLNSQLAAINAQVEEAVVLLGRDGTVDELNGAAARLFGYRSEDVTGRPFEDVLIGDAPLTSQVEKCLEGSANNGLSECRLFKRSGDAFPALAQVRALAEGGCVVTVRDLSSAQNQEQQREHLDQLAFLGQGMHSFAHQLRHPLNSISMGVQYLGMRLPQSDEEVARSLTTIQSECARLSEMMADMLDWAKPIHPVLAPIQLADIMRRLLGRFRAKIERRNVRLSFTVGEALPQVMADGRLLEHVFDNLVDNALQAMPTGGHLMVTVTTDKHPGGHRVTVKVGDSGPGISEENQHKVFDPYFTTKADGTGIGLAISKRLITVHHGAIAVESYPSMGTIFTVTLPALSDTPAEEAPQP
ncbi:MAG: PAS domain S-box protein [Anaerolineales bacterium]|nr:PAS domain S-box protein [Anaerolineales bacterium]